MARVASQSRITRIAMVIVALGVVMAMVRFFQVILTPLVVATFLLLLIDAVARLAEAIAPKAPRWLRASAAAIVILAAFVLIGVAIALQAPGFAARIQALGPRLNRLLVDYGALVGIQATSIDKLFSGLNVWAIVGGALAAARGFISFAFLVTIYLGFLVASRATFHRKIDGLYDTEAHREAARRVISSARRGVEQYVKLQTVKAGITAIAAFAVMAVIGVPDAFFIAFMIFLAVYVPLVGPAIGVILPTVVTFAQFGDLGRAAIVLATMEAAVLINGNVIMPKLQSDQLNIDPLLVLVSLGFWGLLLGAPGAVLSTPLTVTIMAVAAEFEGSRWLAVLLSKDGHPVRDIKSA